jgi:hypothetical protein
MAGTPPQYSKLRTIDYDDSLDADEGLQAVSASSLTLRAIRVAGNACC